MKLILEKENGSRLKIEKFPYTLGRKSDCDCILDGTVASRRHACFIMENASVYVEDLGSSNGTFVNLERINSRVKLNPKDQLKFGDVRMTVIALSEN